MSILVTGSVAIDHIMVFRDRFRNHILPDRLHILNVSFHVSQLRRHFGGTAGNIAYNLKLLGGDGKVMATVGTDFDPYRAWMRDCGLPLDLVRQLDDQYTAQAYITTDAANNQITAFHPGAMNHDHLNAVPTDGSIGLGIVAPESHAGMRQHDAQFVAAGIPFVFDPGQAMTLFNGEELRALMLDGRATRTSQLCEEGSQQWFPAGNVLPELGSPPTSPAPASPPDRLMERSSFGIWSQGKNS